MQAEQALRVEKAANEQLSRKLVTVEGELKQALQNASAAEEQEQCALHVKQQLEESSRDEIVHGSLAYTRSQLQQVNKALTTEEAKAAQFSKQLQEARDECQVCCY